MNSRRTAVLALTSAGVLWGSSMPLSKLSLEWLAPGWLTVVRFGLAALVLAVPARANLRAALTPEIVTWGALGVGVCVVVQNVGVGLTSVSHASMMVGAIPVLVAVIAAVWHRTHVSAQAWTGLLVSVAGVAVVAGGGGGRSSGYGDALVLFSLAVSAAMTVAQTRMLAGRDPMAVTAVQFAAAAVAALPIAVLTEGAPGAPTTVGAGPVVGVLALSIVGTMLPWVLFAHGQARVSAVVAGAFINIEPLVGAASAALFFGETITAAQIGAGLAILTGVALSTLAAAESARQRDLALRAGRAVRAVVAVPVVRPVRAMPPMPLPRQRQRSAWHLEDIPADLLVLDRAA